jgi:large subunit ribosomal protein L23
MSQKNPYDVVKNRHLTEKARLLEQLQYNGNNASVRACKSPKAVFIVASDANKYTIARSIEEIYKEKKIKVVKVNVLNIRQRTRVYRGRKAKVQGYKKAIVTLRVGDRLDEQN